MIIVEHPHGSASLVAPGFHVDPGFFFLGA